MKSAQGKRSHVTRLAVIAAVVLVAVAVLAAPALAAPDATDFSQAYANTGVVNYGGGTLISAVLMDTTQGMALGGLFVDVEQSTTGATGPWDSLYVLTTGAGQPYDTGTYTGPVVPMQNTWYHFVWVGSAAYAAANSDAHPVEVRVKPLLGKPSCPAKIRHGKKFTSKGTLNPMFTSGTKTVTIKVYKKSHKKWVAMKKTYLATNGKYQGFTPYSVRIKLTKKGQYRLRARTTAGAEWAAAVSGYSRTLKVK
jgi:hypothetical protein